MVVSLADPGHRQKQNFMNCHKHPILTKYDLHVNIATKVRKTKAC